MTEIPREIVEHQLRILPHKRPVIQRRRNMKEEEKWMIAKEVRALWASRIVREVRHPTWITNPRMVREANGSWRLGVDYKDLSEACLEDNDLPTKRDSKMSTPVDLPLICYLNTYKGCHQIPMAEDDDNRPGHFLLHKNAF
ncbi:hypothetical protein R6Q59_029502 [Mikania micrantha]